MEKAETTRKRLSPRKQSWIAVTIPYVVFAIAVAFLPIHLALIPVVVSALGAGCSGCSRSVRFAAPVLLHCRSTSSA